METVAFDGLEATLARLTLADGARWQTVMPSGVWCGVVAEGTIATSRSGRGDTWRPRITINCALDDAQRVDHRLICLESVARANDASDFDRLP